MLVLSQTPVLLREDEKHPSEFTRCLPLGSTASASLRRHRKEQLDLFFCQILVDPAHVRKINVLRDRIASSGSRQPNPRALYILLHPLRWRYSSCASGNRLRSCRKKKSLRCHQMVILYVVCINVIRYKVPVLDLKS